MSYHQNYPPVLSGPANMCSSNIFSLGSSFCVKFIFIPKILANLNKNTLKLGCGTLKPHQSLQTKGKIQKNEALSQAQSKSKEHILKAYIFSSSFLKASKERYSFNIVPIHGAQACRPSGLDGRQPGLAWKDGELWTMEIWEKGSYFCKTKMCLMMFLQY